MLDMILAPRRHLYATNIIVFFLIIILQKFITIFCIIEEKACKNINCSSENGCVENCGAAERRRQIILKKKKQKQQQQQQQLQQRLERNDFSLVPHSMRKAMRNFGFGEGHYQIFVEEKQRYQSISEARLNAVDAELKLNPN